MKRGGHMRSVKKEQGGGVEKGRRRGGAMILKSCAKKMRQWTPRSRLVIIPPFLTRQLAIRPRSPGRPIEDMPK